MREEFGVTEMPLAICRRCPDIVPDYLASIVPADWGGARHGHDELMLSVATEPKRSIRIP